MTSRDASYAIVVLLLLAGCKADAEPPAQKEPDADVMCAPYGGVKELGAVQYTIRNTRKGAVKTTGISAYCNDGSYVSRYTEGKP